jgi:Family of unknown function (DUF5683)
MTMTVKPTCKSLLFYILLFLTAAPVRAQVKTDSLTVSHYPTPAKQVPAEKATKTDTTKHVRSDAGKAALRSAFIPGWGQAYNKKYWKIPIVYGALAIPVATFIYNKNWYEKTRDAYKIKYYNDTSQVSDLPTDSMDPQLQPLSTQSTRIYRDEFRKNMDFSVLAFLILWGLNVVDAAVDGHLKSYNVNEDLSFRIKPGYSPIGQTNGLSLILDIGKSSPHKTSVTR